MRRRRPYSQLQVLSLANFDFLRLNRAPRNRPLPYFQMDRGSLEDVLQYNASAVLDADSMVAILRDVVSGMK